MESKTHLPAPAARHADPKTDPGAPRGRQARELLRDPAIWAWLLVALLAIFPAHAALAHFTRGAPAAHGTR